MNTIIPIKLSQLTAKIQGAIDAVFSAQSFWVIADVTNHSFYQQRNYHYFDLVEKEENSNELKVKITAAAWGTGSQKINDFEKSTGQKFRNDINVLIKVSVDFHPKFGLKLSLIDIDPSFTIGLLEQQRQLTLQRLLNECSDFIRKSGEEYITLNKGLNLPVVIKKVAVVSSKTSAGLQDFLHTIKNNAFRYEITTDLYYTTVQGDTSSAQIYNTLLVVFNSNIKYDALVLIRGGGSQTDFINFDEFNVAKIVAKYPTPVITGIGHQKNITIVDMLAHTSTKTPTQAAEFIIAYNKSFEDRMLALQKNILIKGQQILFNRSRDLGIARSSVIENTRQEINILKEKLAEVRQEIVHGSTATLNEKHRDIFSLSGAVLSTPRIVVNNSLNDLNNIMVNIRSQTRSGLIHHKGNIDHFISLFKIADPANLLRQGFALVRKNDKIVADPAMIGIGENISIILADMQINATVNSKQKSDGNDLNI